MDKESKWKICYGNAMLESGSNDNDLGTKLKALFSDNAKKYMSRLESSYGQDKALIESIRIEFLKSLLEGPFEKNLTAPGGGDTLSSAIINFVNAYTGRFNAQHMRFGVEGDTRPGKLRNINIQHRGDRADDRSTYYVASLSADGKRVSVKRGNADIGSEDLKGKVGSDEWKQSLYEAIIKGINGTLGQTQAPTPAPAQQSATQSPQSQTQPGERLHQRDDIANKEGDGGNAQGQA